MPDILSTRFSDMNVSQAGGMVGLPTGLNTGTGMPSDPAASQQQRPRRPNAIALNLLNDDIPRVVDEMAEQVMRDFEVFIETCVVVVE